MARRVDPIQLEVFHHLFASIAEEMGVCLARAALSPNIKERLDLSCAVFTADGELLAQAAHIPVHLGSAADSVRAARAAFDLEPGDAVLLNDPYFGGTHLPDLTLVSPVFCGGTTPAFFVANRAHHADIGGGRPGSMGISADLFGEGLVIPPVRLVRRGEVDRTVLDLLLANVRTPEERKGDLLAQRAANELGVRRLSTLAARHGVAVVRRRGLELLGYSERLVRSSLAALPTGRFLAEDAIEDDGMGSGAVPIRVAVTLRGRRGIAFDFTRSGDQVRGPLNANRSVTLAAVVYTVRCLCEDRVPTNGGLFRPVTLTTRPGSVLDPIRPAAVAGGNVETSQRIVDVCLAALSRAAPDRIPAASAGTMTNFSFGGTDPRTGKLFTFYETIPGGSGGTPAGPGVPAIQTHMTNTRNTPIEDLERRFPVRVLRTEFRRGSGGRARHRGGDGLVREVLFLAPGQASLLAERRRVGPPGAAGGGSGRPGRDFLLRNGSSERIPAKGTIDVRAFDAIRIETPGGGGFGRKERARRRAKKRRR